MLNCLAIDDEPLALRMQRVDAAQYRVERIARGFFGKHFIRGKVADVLQQHAAARGQPQRRKIRIALDRVEPLVPAHGAMPLDPRGAFRAERLHAGKIEPRAVPQAQRFRICAFARRRAAGNQNQHPLPPCGTYGSMPVSENETELL